MLIIAVVVSVSIGITKAKLDNIVSYTYYNAYSTMRKISTEMLADWNPKDPEYKQALNKENKFNIQLKFANIKDNILGIYRDLWTQPAQARCLKYFVPHNSSCIEAGGNVCSSDHEEGVGCYECCTPRCPASCPPCYKIEQMYGKCFCSRDETCGDGNSCSLTCGSGFTLNKTICRCECNRTCGSGYRLNVDTCSCDPSYECWDGSFATSESKCPGYVDCWDGSKKYNWSECPPCPNKPSGPDPCGQHWDEKTCSYTGTAKTCPSGQHLNSSCQCVVDCPSDLTL